MVTPIHLTYISKEEEKAFLGEVPDENLLSIYNEVIPTIATTVNLITHVVKMVLGH